MIYVIFLCTLYATMPQFNRCKIPDGPFLTVYHSTQECKQMAARFNSALRPTPGANVHIQYVCMEKATWQPVE
jgi:hypothetical protein